MRALMIAFALLLVLSATAQADSCVDCHSNREKMEQLGYPQFYFPLEEVQKQTGMPATCVDCHLGNSSTADMEEAHRGVLSVLVIGKKGLLPMKNRSEVLPSLQPKGKSPASLIKPSGKDAKKVAWILWHDRNNTTGAPDKAKVEKTCGKCHPRQVEDYFKSKMGNATLQSSHTLFTVDPQNCGPWFDNGSYQEKVEELSVNFTQQHNAVLNRVCQRCHASCLDCHYAPFKGEGVHRFQREPDQLTCYGGGRAGQRLCHTGPEEYRRGAGTIRGDFSKPPGLPEDVHYKAGIECIECHPRSHSHDFSRFGSVDESSAEQSSGENVCKKCHGEIVRASESGEHSSVACEACHIAEIGGYQLSVWGPGPVGGIKSPMRPNKAFIGRSVPLIIKTPENYWIPVKAFAHITLNIKRDVKPTRGVVFRQKTRDGYAITGVVDALPADNKAMMWVDVEKVSHGISGARSCESCHSKEQRMRIKWSFGMPQFVTQPFKGELETVANSSGLYIFGIRNTTPISLKNGARIVDFFPWYYLRDYVYYVPGDFSIPDVGTNQLERYRTMLEEIKSLRSAIAEAKAKGIDVSAEEKVLDEAAEIGPHNIKEAEEKLEQVKKNLEAKAAQPKAEGICGPTLLALLAAIPVTIKRALMRA